MEVVVTTTNWTTGTIRHAKLQSNRQQQQTPSLSQAGCTSCCPTIVSEHWRKVWNG